MIKGELNPGGLPIMKGVVVRSYKPLANRAMDQSLCRVTARKLCTMTFTPIRYVVPGYIAEGLTLFAGRPKLGKSWFCLDIALAVASGGACLGDVQCAEGDVLYLALEDNLRRLQSRIFRVWNSTSQEPPERLTLVTEWDRGDEGVAGIRKWIQEALQPRLVIVDVLAMFKAVSKDREQTLYEADYMAIKGLQSLAMKTGVAIVVVHHTRKTVGEADPFEKVSGTLGLSGAADTTLILDRTQTGCTIYGRGRDIEEIETAVQFDKLSCRWSVLGDAQEVRRTDERKVILDLLADNREAMSPAEIADALRLNRNNVKQLLFKMAKVGEVVKIGKRGQYSHPKYAGYPDNSSDSDNPDNDDNQ